MSSPPCVHTAVPGSHDRESSTATLPQIDRTVCTPVTSTSGNTTDDRTPITDHILYINLDHRTDRREELERELRTMLVDVGTCVERVSAVFVPERGHLGCARSHVLAVEHALKHDWPYVVILEDDFMIHGDTTVSMWTDCMKTLWQHKDDWDVFLLVAYYASYVQGEHSAMPNTRRLRSASSAAGYVVQRHYYARLLENFHESVARLERDNPTYETDCIDQWWMRLQQRDRWYTSSPRPLARQRPGFSDIGGRFLDYGHCGS